MGNGRIVTPQEARDFHHHASASARVVGGSGQEYALIPPQDLERLAFTVITQGAMLGEAAEVLAKLSGHHGALVKRLKRASQRGAR